MLVLIVVVVSGKFSTGIDAVILLVSVLTLLFVSYAFMADPGNADVEVFVGRLENIRLVECARIAAECNDGCDYDNRPRVDVNKFVLLSF